MTKQQTEQRYGKRIAIANKFLRIISLHGREFFCHKGFVAHFTIDEDGRIRFVDDYSKKAILLRNTVRRWKGFTHGGTMRSLLLQLQAYIYHGGQLPLWTLGPWPLCNDDLWGYGIAEMAKVRAACAALEEQKEQC